ncbi:hypothetical protein ACYQR9_01965 [Methylobacterium sp. CM6241]
MKTIRPLTIVTSEEKALSYLATGEFCVLDDDTDTPAAIALVALFHHLKPAGRQVKIYPGAMNAMTNQLVAIIKGDAINEYDINWNSLLMQGVAWKKDIRATGRCNLALLKFFCHLSDAIRIAKRNSISAKWALYLMNDFAKGEELFKPGFLEDKFSLITNASGRRVLGKPSCFSYQDIVSGFDERDTFELVFARFGKA